MLVLIDLKARRALKALKGLVKLQALVRGNIVRKQAAETLRCMQALVRVQARARACRALRAEKAQSKSGGSARSHPVWHSLCILEFLCISISSYSIKLILL